MRIRLVFWMTLMVVSLAGCGTKERPWRPFTSAECGFSVLLPSVPLEHTERTDNGFLNHSFIERNSSSQFMVMCVFPPPDALASKSEQTWIDEIRDAALKATKSKLVAEKPISLKVGDHSFPGKEFEVDHPEGKTISRVYVLHDRLYALEFRDLSGATPDEDVRRFFDSFTVASE